MRPSLIALTAAALLAGGSLAAQAQVTVVNGTDRPMSVGFYGFMRNNAVPFLAERRCLQGGERWVLTPTRGAGDPGSYITLRAAMTDNAGCAGWEGSAVTGSAGGQVKDPQPPFTFRQQGSSLVTW